MERELWNLRAFDFICGRQMSATFCEAIQYTLELTSTHPEFEHLISKAYSISLGRSYSASLKDKRKFFGSGLHYTLLAWKPVRWSIPREAGLSLETLLTDPEIIQPVGDIRLVKDMTHLRWYFSTTAATIDFFKHLTWEERMWMRGKLSSRKISKVQLIPSVIHEDSPTTALRIRNFELRCM